MATCVLEKQNLEEVSNTKIIEIVEAKVKETIEKYGLISAQDKVLVAVSGGKDSTTCLHILKKLGYDVEAFTVDVETRCYTNKTMERIKRFCEKENVKLHLWSFEKNYGKTVLSIHSHFKKQGKNFSSCTICGVMRRKIFDQAARQANATKIATGHNLDDEVQSILMNTFRNRQSLNARITPLSKPQTRFIPRIKPLFFVTEDEIINYSKAMNFDVPIEDRISCSDTTTRIVVRQFIQDCKKINIDAIKNIMHFFLQVQKQIKTSNEQKQLNKCVCCGAPATRKICRPCQLLQQLQVPAQVVQLVST